MFEAIEQANDTDQQEAVRHVLAIFINAETIKDKMAELKEQEHQRRVGTYLENQKIVKAYQITGLPEAIQSYEDNMAELEVDGVGISELYLATIKEHKSEVENRLEGFRQHQTTLNDKLLEIQEREMSLNKQSSEYTRLLAQGDIAAADCLESERLEQLRTTQADRQSFEHKISAAKKAEIMVEREFHTYRDMFVKAHQNVKNQKVTHILKPRFDQQFMELQATYLELSQTVATVWGGKVDKWEHKDKLKELVDKTGRDFVSRHFGMEQSLGLHYYPKTI